MNTRDPHCVSCIFFQRYVSFNHGFDGYCKKTEQNTQRNRKDKVCESFKSYNKHYAKNWGDLEK